MIVFRLDDRYRKAYPDREKLFSEVKDDNLVEVFANRITSVSIRIGDNIWLIEPQGYRSTVISDLVHKLGAEGYRIVKRDSDFATLQRESQSTIYLTEYPVLPDTIAGEHITRPSTGMCFIATAAFGGSLSPQVMELRRFRDDVLLKNRLGKNIIEYYQTISPPVARVIDKSPLFQFAVRTVVIRPLICLIRLGESIKNTR